MRDRSRLQLSIMRGKNNEHTRDGFRERAIERARARHARKLANRAKWIADRMRKVGAHKGKRTALEPTFPFKARDPG